MARPLADVLALAGLLALAAPVLRPVATETSDPAPPPPKAADSVPDLLPDPKGEPLERLAYRARAWAKIGFVGKEVGTATFEIFREPESSPARVRIRAAATGSALGYSIRAVIESLADASTLAPVRYRYIQEGSSARKRGFDFGEKSVSYWKQRHCRGIGCVNAAHYLASPPGKPPIHCPDHGCENPAHQVWQMRRTRELDVPAFDVLTAIYRARALDFDATPPPGFRLLVDKDGDWDVTVRSLERATITVPAGSFKCRKIRIETKRRAPGKDDKEEFEGPFGLKGDITLWVDESTRIPVRISGKVPFGIDFNAEVDLVKREGAFPEPPAGGR